jgi:DNA helicase-2/ATP-dependent DNA helicase PcrA
VDEAQDTDRNQWRIINLFEPETRFVVGDADQSIHEWRGGNPKLFMAFGETARIYGLRNSYRFGFNIAAPAQALIAHNVQRINLAIRAIADNAGTVEVHDSLPYAEIAGIIQRELEGGRPPADIAVLARRHKTLEPLDAVLTAARIPFYRVGAEQAIPQTPEFRILRAYLRSAQNPRDSRAFMRLSVAEGLDTAALLDLRERANTQGCTLADAYGKTLPGTLAALAPYLATTDPYRDYRPAFDYARALMRDHALSDERELLDHLATASVSDQVKDVQDRVTVGTIHHAKGLEWPVVLLIGLNSQQFPSPRSIREGRQEEERRLAYVAMTRAEQTLYLISTPPEGPRDGRSSFLGEIGDVRRMERDPWGGDDLVM